MNLSRNFTTEEFARACGWHEEEGRVVPDRELTDVELEAARWWASSILQPARDDLGPIIITWRDRHGGVARGYVRPNSASHSERGAVDVYTLAVPTRRLYEWLAERRRILPIGRVIYERNHVHVARRGPEPWAGEGLAFLEPREGVYELDESVSPVVLL